MEYLSAIWLPRGGYFQGRNLTALGGFAALFDVSPDWFREVITKKFRAKGERVLEINLKSFDAGYRYALEKFGDRLRPLFTAKDIVAGSEKVMLSGNQMIGQAALDAGLRLYFGYPITPATPIMEFLAKHLPREAVV